LFIDREVFREVVKERFDGSVELRAKARVGD